MLVDAMMETLMMVMNTSIMLEDIQETICVVTLGVSDTINVVHKRGCAVRTKADKESPPLKMIGGPTMVESHKI